MLGRSGELTHGRLLARNVGLNLAGWVLPALSALFAFPILVRSMGAERFGLLSLAWTIVGYFSAFDLGIGRALTQALAARVGADDQADSPFITWTAFWLLLPIGLLCGVALAAGAPSLAASGLRVSPAMRGEAITAVQLLAVAVPLMVLTSGLRGVLEAGQRFRTINALRVPLGLLTFLGPLAALHVSNRLPAAVAVLAAARALVFGLHVLAVGLAHPELRRPRAPRAVDLARLWKVAGWMTVSSIVSPVLVSADRFVIGTVLPLTAVAHYATASEVATKMWLFTAALQPVLFPALAATLVSAPQRAAVLFDRGVRATTLALAPATLILVLFAPELLTGWLGPAFAAESAPLLRWLAIAVFVNALASVPHSVLQSAGRADLPGKLHALELPLYFGALWALLPRFGLLGVAYAWLLRMAVDALAQLAAVPVVLPDARRAVWRAGAIMVGGMVLLAPATLPMPLVARVVIAVAAIALFLAGAPRWLVTGPERAEALAWSRQRAAALRRRPRDDEAPAPASA